MSGLHQRPVSQYPRQYDEEDLLSTARDGLKLELAKLWSPGDDTLVVTGATPKLAQVPDMGYVTVYLKNAPVVYAAKRAVTLWYGSIDRSTNTLLGIQACGTEMEPRPIGCDVIFNVVAEHHMGVRDATIALEHYVGARFNPDSTSIEAFAQELTYLVKRPVPYFLVLPSRAIIGQHVQFKDYTFRLQAWQSPTFHWEFGDGNTSEERHPLHVYENPGVYDITLTVTNEYGTRSLMLEQAVAVQGKPPDPATVSVYPEIAIANETLVTFAVENPPYEAGDSPIADYAWDANNNISLPNAATIQTKYGEGGLYTAAVKRTTRMGSFAWDRLSKPVNIVERYSLWAVQTPNWASPKTTLEEYMPMANAWKASTYKTTFAKHISPPPIDPVSTNGMDIDAARIFTNANGALDPSATWHLCNGLHEEVGSFNGHWFYASGPTELNHASYNSLSDTWQNDAYGRFRGWGWQVTRLNWQNAPELDPNVAFVMFGLSDGYDLMSRDNMFVDTLHLLTGVWEVRPLPVTSIEDITVHSRPIRWRCSPWETTIYVWRSTSDVINTGYTYEPLVDSWTSLGVQSSGQREFDMEEGSTASLYNGIWMFNHSGKVSMYQPSAGSWYETGASGTIPWADPAKANANDALIPILIGTRSVSPGISSTSCWIASRYSTRAIGSFSPMTVTSTSIPQRPDGTIWAMGVY